MGTQSTMLTEFNVSDPPDLDLNFLSNVLDSPGAFTRSSSAWYFDRNGDLVQASTNEPRFDHDPVTLVRRGLLLEPGRTNFFFNPRCEGLVPGTPGTLPLTWSGTFGNGVNGLSSEIIGNFTVDGFSVARVRIFGTTTGSGFARLAPSASLSHVPPVVLGEVVTSSIYVRLVSGNYGSFTWRTETYGVDSGGAFVPAAGTVTTSFAPTNGPLREQRVIGTFTITNASVAYGALGLDYIYTPGVTVDFTVDIAAPQFEKGTFATSPMLPPIGTRAASTRAADVFTLNNAGRIFTHRFRMNGGSNAVIVPVPITDMVGEQVLLNGSVYTSYTKQDDPFAPGVSTWLLLGSQPPAGTIVDVRVPWSNVSGFSLLSETVTTARLSGAGGATNHSVQLNDETSDNVFSLSHRNSGSPTSSLAITDGGITTNQASSVLSLGTVQKHIGAHSGGDVAYSANAGPVATSSGFTLPPLNQIRAASFGGAGASAVTHLRRISYWRRRLSDSKLQELTAL